MHVLERSSMPISEFFLQNAQELRLDSSSASQLATRLGQELLYSTEAWRLGAVNRWL